ncbi:MAG: effector binding domain-containing protein [Eubacteriales bacterium]|nr:effector binding domain-containing protein [Eubacteriales bacterium]
MEGMTVSEVSRRYSVSTRMLRYYEKIGLLQSGRREEYAYRMYDETAVRRLQILLILRKLRIPLKQIAVILDDGEQLKTLTILQENLKELDDELAALGTVRDILDGLATRLEERIRKSIRLDLLADGELASLAQSLSLSPMSIAEEKNMDDLNKANAVLKKLTDKEVRIIHVAPVTVAAVHRVSDSPEADCLAALRKMILECRLCERKPDFRVFGFNHDVDGVHGYEHWITVPDDLELPAPFVKKHYGGGLYGAHMIPMGAFEEWKWLYEWAQSSEEYEIDWRAPECMMGGMLEEHLNFIHIFDNDMDTLDQIMQLDLLVPIRKRKG